MERSWRGRRPLTAELANKALNCTFLSINKESSLFRSALQGRRLSDLGAGNPHAMMLFADYYGAREYVGVDASRDYSMLEGILVNTRFERVDMLRFLGDQEDCSSNIVMNNIDRAVLSMDDRELERAYSILMLHQIARVVPPGGIAFGIGTDLLHGLAHYRFLRMEHTGAYSVSDAGAVYLKP